jgi:hypothetical protein
MTTTISGSSGIVFPDLTSMQTGQQAVKAWVNFNGTGTVAIRAGYNVSSITDNGVGIYAVNFTTAMPDANYSGLVTGGDLGTVGRAVGGSSNASRTTTSFAVRTLNETQVSLTDCDTVYVAIFR